MADKNLFRGLSDVQMKTNYNHFDLSHRSIFTAEAGFLKPVFCCETVPDDKIKINVGALVRTQPLTTAAFLRCKGFMHFYFVPYSQMWRRWPEFLAQREDPTSSYENGYNYVPVFNLKTVYETISQEADQTQDNTHKDVFGQNMIPRAAQLVEMLGYGGVHVTKRNNIYVADNTTNVQQVFVNPFRAAAYQKIWSDYYRNPWYDPDVPVNLFNFDDFDCSDNANNQWEQNRSGDATVLFTPRFRGWKKDLFMGSMPSTQDGAVSSISIANFDLRNSVYITGSSSYDVGVTNANNNTIAVMRDPNQSVVSGSRKWNIDNAFDVLQLRRAEALQRWKESTMRAGQRSQSQHMAHYGTYAKHVADERCEYVGGFDFDVSVDEVVATTNFEGANAFNELGQIAGKGIAVTPRNEIEYHASEFGVLMGVVSFLPESEYGASGIDQANTLSQPFDFFTKEFENTGLVPLSRYVLDYSGAQTAAQVTKILGYVPPFSMYKTAFDKVHGPFRSGNSLSSWTTPRVDITAQSLNPTSIGLPKQLYYVNPKCLDTIFAVASDSTDDTDPFLINCHFNVQALRNMSVLGLPQY